MADRVTIPATSVGIGALLGLGSAAATIALSHPVPTFGGLAAAAAICGGLLFAAGFVTIGTESSAVQLAGGGIAVYCGLVLVVGSVGLASARAAPISILAAGFAIGGLAVLSLVVVGYTDAAALAGHDRPLRIWSVLLLAGGIAAVGLSTATNILTEDVGDIRGAYFTAISDAEPVVPALVLIHVFIIPVLVRLAVGQLQRVELLSDRLATLLAKRLRQALLAFFVVVLVPALVTANELMVAEIAHRSPGVAAGLTTVGSLAYVPVLHRGLFSLEALALLVFVAGLVLRAIRGVRVEQAATWVGYAVTPVVVFGSLTVAIGVIPDVVAGADDRLEGVAAELLTHLVEGITAVSLGQQIGIAALVGTGLFVAAGLTLWLLRIVLNRLYGFRSRGLAAAASAGLFVGAVFLGFTGVWPPVVACCLVAAILTWDTLENGVGLGEQLDGRFNAVHNEVVHLFASGAVAGVALLVWLGTYEASRSLSAGEAPSALVVGLLLSAAVVFALLLRRAGR